MYSQTVADSAASVWVHRNGVLPLDEPVVMGIVNVTPDSFSDGGMLLDAAGHLDKGRLRAKVTDMVGSGAQVLDIGGESTRPGAATVSRDEEIRRVVPAIEVIADLGIPISIDTRHASVADAAIRAGASVINDVSGLADPKMLTTAAMLNAGLVIGHMRGTPATMQRDIHFDDLLGEVTSELIRDVHRAIERGVKRDRILVDPCVGFGKDAEQSAALVSSAAWLRRATGCAVLIGASRKRFLGRLTPTPTDDEGPQNRTLSSVVAALMAVEHGASVVRVHDVGPTVTALRTAWALREAYRHHEGVARRRAR